MQRGPKSSGSRHFRDASRKRAEEKRHITSHLARVMAATDLAIEPKRATSAFGNEALSTKILEFMALGVPIVASRTRIHAYYYDESIIKYYDSDDEASLANCILLLR